MAVVLCFVVAWRRDAMTVQSQLRALSGVVDALQATVDRVGRLPAEVPTPTRTRFTYYLSDADRFYAMHTDKPVIVATMPPVSLLMGERGQAVVIYHDGRVRAEWMTESQYEKAKRRQERDIEAFEEQRRNQPLILP